MKNIRLCFMFYKSFGFVSLTISMICSYFFLIYGISANQPLFIFKVSSMVLIYCYVKHYKHYEVYYYKNLGLKWKHLLIFALILDSLVYFSLMIIGLIVHYEKYS